jgi:long-chain acyl-CoA synthetase
MSFGRELLVAFENHADRVAVVTGGEEITYRQALSRVGHIAANFRAAGVRPGSFVGLAMQDTVDVLLGIVSCWRLSATAVVIDFRSPRVQRAASARDFNLSIVFETYSPPGDEHYASSIFDPEWRYASAPGETLPFAGSDSNPALLLFSSGTTGTPKAYIQTHDGLTGRIVTRNALLDSGEMRFLTPMALTYSATRHQVFAYLLRGGTVSLVPPLFSPSELVENLLSFRASGTALPPSVIARLNREAGERPEPLFPRLSVLASVGGPARADDKIAAYTNLSPSYRMGYASSLTGIRWQVSGSHRTMQIILYRSTHGAGAGSGRLLERSAGCHACTVCAQSR